MIETHSQVQGDKLGNSNLLSLNTYHVEVCYVMQDVIILILRRIFMIAAFCVLSHGYVTILLQQQNIPLKIWMKQAIFTGSVCTDGIHGAVYA